MEKFDLIGQLHRAAQERGWAFCPGDVFYQNIETTEQSMASGQLVLTAEFNAFPIFVNGRNPEIEYRGSIMLGRKVDEDGTNASLDEDFMDKYQRRLLELMQLLAVFLGSFECENDLSILSSEFILSLNRFDTNIDFVGGNITIKQ